MNEIIAQVTPASNILMIASMIAIVGVIAWNAINMMVVIPWKHGMKWQVITIIGMSFTPMIILCMFPSVMGYCVAVAFSTVISTMWIMKLTPIWKQVGISNIQCSLVIAGQPLVWIPAIVFIFLRKRNENAETVQEVPA